jgi:cell wall-associated NlpC family hydrolase
VAFPSLNRRFLTSVVAGLGAVIVTVSLAPAAQAEPTIAEVTTQLSTLSRKNEQLTELFNKATIDATAKKKQAAAAKVAAAKALAAYQAAQKQMRLSLNAAFRAAGRGGATTAILTSSSSQNYLDQVTTLQMVAARRSAVAQQLRSAKASADSATKTATALLADANAKVKDLGQQRDKIVADTGKYQDLLDKLTAEQRARYIAAQNPTPAPQVTQQAVNTYKVHAPSGAAAIAIKFALAQLGKPYAFAAAGPYAFDCSGLTMAAWGAAGVSLPHFAESQYNYGTHVSRDQLLPGDLVFFYQPIGHVALYIGNGLIVHAPTYGDVVKIVPLSTFDSDYVGATRL